MRLLLLGWLGLLVAGSVWAAGRPNILVIIVDDQGWSDIGYHSKAQVTPNLDQLRKEGVELQRFYVYPLCSPTRLAYLTGQMPRRFGVTAALGPRDKGMPAGLVTIPGLFKAAGYRTSLIGKWHLGTATSPQDNGYEHFYGFLNAEIDYYKHTAKGGRVDWQRDGKTLEEEGYSTYLMADEARKQIVGRDKTKPFYLQVNFNAPHVPFAAPAELIAKHQAEGERKGLYAAVIEAMDIAIGRVLATLESEKLREDTLVVFFSDNGGDKREGGDNSPFSMGKGSVYEGGIRTPALMRWASKLPSGGSVTQPICVQDLMPTIASAAGVTLPNLKIDGVSQWLAITQGKAPPRPPFLIATWEIALIDGDWKMMESLAGKRALFNLKDDVGEAFDLMIKQPEVAKRLGSRMDELKAGLPPASAPSQGPGAGGGGGPKGGKKK